MKLGDEVLKSNVILYIGGFELPDKNAAAHRVLSNAKIFRKLGKEVVFVGIDKSLSVSSNILNTQSMIQGFKTFSVPYPKTIRNWIKYLTDIGDYIKICKKFKNIEMIILYNFQSIAMRKLMFYCKKNKIKCCSDITEWRSTKGEKLIYRVFKGSDTWYRMHILHKKLDGLIVISRFLENYYKECKNVVYVPALVDLKEEKWKGSYKKSEDEIRLVYAGNPGRKDRLDKLVEALDNVKCKYVLDVIGISLEQYLEYYPKHIRLLNRNKSIVFHGRISHLKTIEFIKKANYSCFFRENDRVSRAGFPTKFVESISCGTPVITNKSSDLEEYLINGINGYWLEKDNDNFFQSFFCKLKDISCMEKVDCYYFDYRRYISNFKNFFNERR